MRDSQERLLHTISSPDLIIEGDNDTKQAVKFYEKINITSKYLIVIYKEISKIDGFILTAYLSNQYAKWRKIHWKK